MSAEAPNESSAKDTGSPSAGEPVFIAVGRLRRPHGIRGEIIMDVLTDFPERLHAGVVVYLGEQHTPIKIRGQRAHQEMLLLSFRGYSTPEQVGELRNQIVMVRADDRPPLEEGEYYHHQLLGLQVVTDEGQYLGRLAEILETGANDVYIVQPEKGPEILLPGTREVILDIDLEKGEIRVHLLPGLLPESE